MILVAVFLFILRIVIRVSGFLGKIINATIILALPNKLLGMLVGFIEGYVIVFFLLNALMIPLSNNSTFMESGVRSFIMTETPILKDSFGGINKALEDIFTKDKQNENINMNLQVIDTMLKYNVVTPSYVDKMIKSGKIENTEGINDILEKYKEE